MSGPFPSGPTAELVFALARDGRTVLRVARVRSPLAFTRAFAAADDPLVAEAWLQSTTGGLHAGDDVSVRIVVEDGAVARVSPQAATVVLGVIAGRGARMTTELVVGEGARLEWVPPATVLVPGARLDASTTVAVAGGGVVTMTDLYALHSPRPGVEEPAARLFTEIEAVVGDRTAAVDRVSIDGAWTVAAHGSVWSVGTEPGELVDELLQHGIAAGALPNRAGVAVRLAGTAGGVQDAALRTVAAIRVGCRAAAPPARLPS
ncbi:MAG: urease accessory protein UreD [Acidimicrobiia bacterium]